MNKRNESVAATVRVLSAIALSWSTTGCLQPSGQIAPVGLAAETAPGLQERWGVDEIEFRVPLGTTAVDATPGQDGWAKIIRCNVTGAEFILIEPANPLWIGAQSEDPNAPNFDPHASENAGPVHLGNLTGPFYLGATELTVDQWQAVTELPAKYQTFDSRGQLPMSMVSWNECQDFIAHLNVLNGASQFRLPTEDEWEYAYRAGTNTPFYAGDRLDTFQARFDDNPMGGLLGCEQVDPEADLHLMPTLVASYAPNSWGLFDMAGNVAEWCADVHSFYLDGSESEGFGRVIRGGDSESHMMRCRASARNRGSEEFRSWFLGLRLVLEPRRE